MMQAIGRGLAIGSCKPVRRSITIGSCGAAVLHLVVFYCRSSIAILPARRDVRRHVHASIDCRVILYHPPGLFGGRFYS